MKTICDVFCRFFNDISKIYKQFILFCIVYLLNYACISVIPDFVKIDQKNIVPITIVFFLVVMINIIVFPINQYLYQKNYSDLLGLNYEVNRFSCYLKNLIKVYLFQFLLALVISVLVSIGLYIIALSIKVSLANMPRIIASGLVVVNVVWFSRIIFVNNILVYKREKYIT